MDSKAIYRALVVAMAYHVEEAKERQREAGGDRKSQEYQKSVHAPVHEADERKYENQAISKAGKLFNVSGRTVACHTQEEIGWTSIN